MLTYEVTNESEEWMRTWKGAVALNLWETSGKVVMEEKLNSTVTLMMRSNTSSGMMSKEEDAKT